MVNPFDLTGQVALVIGAAAGGPRRARGDGAGRPGRDGGDGRPRRRRPEGRRHRRGVGRRAAAGVVDGHGRLDVVVNAAGVMLRKPYDETTLEEFEHVVRVNLTGTWLVGREAGKVMAAAGGGRIVNLTTVYAERVGPGAGVGVLRVQGRRGERDPGTGRASSGRRGVTVNCLAPGVFYPTKMTAALGSDPDRLDWFAGRTMLGRLGDPTATSPDPCCCWPRRPRRTSPARCVYVDGGWSAW